MADDYGYSAVVGGITGRPRYFIILLISTS